MPQTAIPTEITDETNARILAVSEDRIQGFLEDPLAAIAAAADLPLPVVLERLRAMLEAGIIRRIRQTLLATNLAPGALVAWRIDAERLDEAFEYMAKEDPFSGHVVVRSTDAETPGAAYRLWTTLKVPQGFSMAAHADFLRDHVGAEAYRLMPARRLFALGVGHVRRRGLPPGSRSDEPGQVLDTSRSWSSRRWSGRCSARSSASSHRTSWSSCRGDSGPPRRGVSYEEFVRVAQGLHERGVIGRFSTFLEHVKPSAAGTRVTRYNALFHWRVPEGREIEAGREVGRHHVITHAYWREGGPEFANVNIMAVAHGTDKTMVLAHKAAIDEHLAEAGIPVSYTNVFWGGRSEIKPSEILPGAYESWARSVGMQLVAG